MRRSQREVKKPVLFTYQKKGTATNSESAEDDEGASNSDQSDGSDNEMEISAPKTKKTSVAKSRSTKPKISSGSVKTNGNSRATCSSREAIDTDGNFLFESIKSNVKVSVTIDEWIEQHIKDKVKAIAVLFNFVLLSAGAETEWIETDCDLEALEADEINELLTDRINQMAATNGSKSYPLSEGGKKKSGAFKDRYSLFWSKLGEKLRSTKSVKKSSSGPEILRVIVDLLISFSILALVNIRNAATVASLSLGKSLLDECVELNEQISVVDRQLVATAKGQKKVYESNPKYQACLKQKNSLKEEYSLSHELCVNIFESVFIHRIKDSKDELRCFCSSQIAEWLLDIGTADSVCADNLKYLGWQLFDHNNSARKLTVQSFRKLLEMVGDVRPMQDFVERFIDRVIEMAVGDIDQGISLESIELLRSLQLKGLLDTTSEEKLDLVDGLVFDITVDQRIRDEAFRFVLDHTEGFDEQDLIEFDFKTHNKRKKHRLSAGTDVESMEKKKRIALQIETLTEFAEHHLSNSRYSQASHLAVACLHSPFYYILLDWNTILALLVRESEDLITSALRSSQINILLSMFTTSAIFVIEKNSKIDNSVRVSTKSSTSIESCSKEILLNLVDSLNAELLESLPALFIRFRDDPNCQDWLLRLFGCLQLSSQTKQVDSIVKLALELLQTVRTESSLLKIVSTLATWSRTIGPLSTSLNVALGKMLQSSWRDFLSSCKTLSERVESYSGDKKKKNARKSTENHGTILQLDDALKKMKVCWMSLDCRSLLEMPLQEYFDELVEGTSVIQLLIEQNWNVPETEEWEYLDLMRCGRTLTDNDTSEESISQIQALVDAVCSLRTKLIDVALSWMDESMVLKPTKSSRHLQREAFRLVSEVRALFPVKLSEFLYLESAAYSPSEEVLLAMKRVFDSERTLVNEALANLDDSEESKQSGKELSAILVNNLLVPIKDGALNDMKNTNRRQMAAIVSCIADPSEQVQDVVKTLIKKLKDYDVVKYMEIQLLSLKNCYLENVKPHLLSPPEEDSENENEQELIEASYEVSENLSRKLALTMGVGKLKGKHLDALMSFFRAGMTFALSDAKHIGFVQLLQNYFKFLPFNCFSILSNELSALVENCTDVADEIAAWDEDSNMELRRLLCFRDALEGGCKKIVSRGADDDFKRSQINISRNNHDDNSSGGQTSDEESETTGTKGYVPSRKTSSRAPSMRLSANSTVSQKSDKAMAWKGNSRDKPPGTDGANEFSLGLQLEEVPELSSESSEMSSSKRPSKRKGSVEDTEDTTEMDRIPSRRRYR